jgi:MFS family permease
MLICAIPFSGVGMGIALGLLFLPSVSIASHYFRRRRVLAMGITISGSSCGGIVLPILLNQLFQKPNVGFAWGVRAAAFLLLGCLSLATVLMTTRLPNRRQREAAGIPSPKPDFKGVLSDPSFSLTALGLVARVSRSYQYD